MSTEFEGRIVLVAGGTGGLGRAVTRAFLDAGATVVTGAEAPDPAWRVAVDSA